MNIEIHAIDRDHGDGRYVRRHAFAAPTVGTANHMHPELEGLVMHQDVYGGLVATVEVPDGSEIGENNGGNQVLVLPDGACLCADDVVGVAGAAHPWHRMGLKITKV